MKSTIVESPLRSLLCTLYSLPSNLASNLSLAGYNSSALRAPLALLCTLALCSIALTGCQDNDAPYNVLVDSMGSGIVAFKQDPIALSRTACNNEDQEHVNSTPRHENRFIPGQFYYIWGYKAQDGASGREPNFSTQIFPVASGEPMGEESNSHYVELKPDENKKYLSGEMFLYGYTDNTPSFHHLNQLPEPSRSETAIKTFSLAPATDLENKADISLWGYHDYCRGHIYYDPEALVTSSFDMPFTHVMSQVKVTVIQTGEEKYKDGSSEDDENQQVSVYDRTDPYAIKLLNIKLANELPTASYDAISDTYNYNDVERTNKTNGRIIWQSESGQDIPLQSDHDPNTNIEAISLLMPQRWDSQGKADYDFNAEWQPSGSPDLDNFTDAVWLELTITGDDAWKFDNEYQESASTGDNNADKVVTVRLPIKDNTLSSDAPLAFLPNHAYNLVVVFHGDDVHIVTIKPLLYPWFDGERDDIDRDGLHQDQDMGSPMVFGNVQWNDRYMGSDWVAPTNLEQFVMATGFYYQKDRSIPFYPTEYVGGYVYDLDGNVHDLDWAADKVGETHNDIEVYDKTYEEYYNKEGSGVKDIWAGKTTMTRIYTTGGQVMFRAGGHWEDATAAQMMNDLPVVHPVVSYYLPPAQIEIPGIDKSGNDSYIAYVEDYHAYGTSGDYCCTVDDYYDKATGKINTFSAKERKADNNGDITYTGNRIMRFVSDMRDVTPGTWEDVNKHPCPPGWRLPTADELFTIFPSTPLAGNFTFLEDFRINDGSVGGPYGGGKADNWSDIEPTYLKFRANGETFAVKEAYVRIPYREDHPNEDLYPPLESNGQYNYGNNESQRPDYIKVFNGNHYNNKPINFPAYDPEPEDVTQYVISKRHFTEEEFNDTKSLSATDKAKIPGATEEAKKALYVKYAGKNLYGKPIPFDNLPADGKHAKYVDREWGTIYAIKKQGSPDAYRMRWRVERVQEGYDIYQIVIDKYKCSQYDKLEYDFSYMGQKDYYLEYDWDHPESSLYFPVTGIIADHDMSQYNKDSNGNYLGGPRLYNYGTETIILTSSFTDFYSNPNAEDPNDRGYKRYAAAYRIKVTGTDSYCMYLYPSMERLAQGGQVRPVRTAR